MHLNRYAVLVAIAAAAAVAFVAGGLYAQAAEQEGHAVKVGEKMPAFTMKDYTGKEHSLSDFEGKVVVVDFSSQECPYSRGVDPDFAKFATEYKDKPVVFLSVDSNRNTEPEAIAAYAKEKELPFPILKDTDNEYADKAGATRTPEMFVLDEEQVVRYHGAYDDRRDPSKTGETNHVKNAVDALLAGEEVAQPQMALWGCGIKRVAKPAESS